MSYKCFEVSIENKIAHIVLNRPEKRNSMIPEFWDELPAIIRELDKDSAARVIVLSSTGPHFTSGLDTSVFGSSIESHDNPETLEKLNRQRSAKLYDTIHYMQQTFTCLEECRVPVLAAIQGGSIGGGVDLITACDMRYMTTDGFLTIFEIFFQSVCCRMKSDIIPGDFILFEQTNFKALRGGTKCVILKSG